MQYFYSLDGNTQLGPVDAAGLKAAGVGPTTMVWAEGMGDWQAAGSVPALAGLFPATPVAPPPPPRPGPPPPPPGSQGYDAHGVGYPAGLPAKGTNGMAIASHICGIAGIVTSCCCPCIFSILAVVFGHIARRQIRRGLGSGDGIAKVGLILGYGGIVLGLMGISLNGAGHGIRVGGMPNVPGLFHP